ncbi:superoxide dismutase [Streptomyces sp. CRN 30]|uniref:superoxide dismutase n=1 Tax=Streptomyces sp. CRN 30 TaxID=3075613 RepID=UPI002A829891|nr:superoxide dismutase [Streptomyces sp. CRN 30]
MAPTDRSFARRSLLTSAAASTGAALTGVTLTGGPAAAAGRGPWPRRFPLPTGFRPEGIAIGSAPYAYFGSLVDGDIYRASLATGRGAVVAEGPGAGHGAAGLRLDRHGRLFVAGAESGEIRTVDVRTGETERIYATGTTFVNDVVLTPDAAWFTDSYAAVLHRVALDERGRPGGLRTVTLGGDWEQGPDFTANGIERTPDGSALLVVNVFADGGRLMRVDPRTGTARAVDLGAARLPNGDGLLLLGRTLYAVQQWQNAIDVFRLNAAGTRGTAIGRITDERFRIPTTVAAWGDRLYLPNARFDIDPPLPDTEFDAVAVDRI